MIALSLRRFFPEHWDGVGNDYLMAQHVDDVIGFIEKLDTGPVDLMGHSRGGHIGFRVAQARPDLLRKAGAGRTGRRPRPGASARPARLPASRRSGRGLPMAAEKIRSWRHRRRARIVRRWHRRRRRLGAPAGRGEAAIARQRQHADRPGRRESQAVHQERSRIDQDADAADRRRRYARRAVTSSGVCSPSIFRAQGPP